MTTEQKNYAAGMWVREKTFQNGNSILNCSGETEKFVEWLRSITDDQGKFRIGISKRREPSDKGLTHTVWQDTWKPTPVPAGFGCGSFQRREVAAASNRDADLACNSGGQAEKPIEDQDNLPF